MFAFNKFAIFATAVAGLQLASTSAQTISSQCQSTLLGIMASSAAACLNTQALVGLVLSTTANNSVVPTVDNWLVGICTQPACSNQTLSTLVHNVTSGCQSDLNTLGFSGLNADQLTALVQSAYPTIREVACLADSKQNNKLCVTEFLTGVQSSTGNLTFTNLEGLASTFGSTNQTSVPKNVTCSDCVKAAYSVVSKGFGQILPSSVGTYFQNTCDASFTDGSTPSEITQLAAATTIANGARPLALSFAPAVGILASVLIAASSAFFVLA